MSLSSNSNSLGRGNDNRTTILLQTLLVILICIGLVTMGIVLGVFKQPANSHVITYKVSNDNGIALITYTTPDGKQTTPAKINTPWEMSMTVSRGTQVYLTAGSSTQGDNIVCTILLDRKAWKKETAEATSANVACGGIVP
jgi:hypothetical protein